MDTAKVTHDGDHQTIHLPSGIRLPVGVVSVRQQGESVILEPVRASTWPEGFFDDIHIADPAFERPEQGTLPNVARWYSPE